MRKRNILCMLLVFALTITGGGTAYATKQEVSDTKKKVTSLEKEKERVEKSLKNLESLKTDAAAYVKRLDEEVGQLDRELEDLDEKITGKEADIEVTKSELEDARQIEQLQYEDMKLRIKYMYERGDSSYLDLLLQATDMVQLLNRAEYIQKISEYDRRKMNEYIESKEKIAAHEILLEQEHQELLTLQEETLAKQQSVETLLTAKTKELNNFKTQIADAQEQITAYEKDIKAQEDHIKKLEAEIKRKEEEARKAAEAAGKKYNTVSLGDIKFTWPCPSSSRITSEFGAREQPTAGASTNHKGIDIGAKSGSAIVAAADGTVVVSTYSYSAGNYIMINHGGGIYTVYMHCSALLASEGQTVKKGETIAKVGSTGYSTGPHLHFGVRSGGTYLNPLHYVSP